TKSTQRAERCQRRVLAAIHRKHQSLAFAVFRQKSYAGLQRMIDGTRFEFVTSDENFSRRRFIQPEDCLRHLATSGANQPGKSKPFTRAQRKTHAGKLAR